MVPGVGVEILYGFPENEFSIPQVLSVQRLGSGHGTFSGFEVCLEEDALNDFIIHQINGSGIYLDFNFDLQGVIDGGEGIMQLDVGTSGGQDAFQVVSGNTSPYPTRFDPIEIQPDYLNRLKNFEEFEIKLQSQAPQGSLTVVLHFRPTH